MRRIMTTLSLLTLLLVSWAQSLQAGAAALKITPTKQVFLAGYSPNRPNTGGVHDDIWARALVVQAGQERLAIVVCDLLGLLRDDVQKIRQRVKTVPPERVMVLCTHTHSGPDTIGLWGPSPTQSGRDEEYMQFVIETAARAVDEAAAKMQPATVGFAKTTIEGVAYNFRVEKIVDTEAAVMQFRSKADGKVIATLTNFACHPEVLNNDQLTSDFCHWYYQTVESQVGGVAIFANGALGGMISPAPDPNSPAPKGRDWARAERYGKRIAERALEAIANARFTDTATIEHRSATYTVPLQNERFRAALEAGIIPRGPSVVENTVTTESHLIRLGEAVIFTMPGEVLPNLGILLKQLLAPYGDPVFLFGLANDELGYILSEADYYLDLYSYERSMSVGIEIGPAMLQAARQMMAQLTPRTPTVAASAGDKSPIEQELEKYLRRFRPDRAGNFRATYRLVLEGVGEFYLRIADGKATLSKQGSPAEAAVTIKAPAQVFLDIINGKRDPLEAYNLGELQVEGDLGIAQYLLFVFE
ncbi:MAG: neutral/alkaline non-lysosomal ceramidase N-terminal domain-containing protein [Fimbriimonadales bacterium]|nr:neutral/alkaline non-lysosomal ceramidase N-terminal domain-containing protein [Fimbriimonadales bacterium]MDW8051395.1 neutral/alkaline non-lysosomal ceramidase N-terminal domain-containing protein [Armatimonadota bacterium]